MELFDKNEIKEVYGVEDILAEECEPDGGGDPFEVLRQEVEACKKNATCIKPVRILSSELGRLLPT